ncbi:hypothetical protein [Solibacillus sp. FSL K6-1523]|uniref:hypothetical protein n=1 Tax=Solibacillus sp. FSL K6-1523 TaxID=2921471 RepID=UPI0030F4C762
MKKLTIVLIILIIFIGIGTVYYRNLDNNYSALEDFYSFPIPNDAVLEEANDYANNYYWEPSTGTSIPMKYRLVIYKNGWKKAGIDGSSVIYEKNNYQYQITVVYAKEYIGIGRN